MSWSATQQTYAKAFGQDVPRSLTTMADGGALHYGDPPNMGCCPAGPTMSSIPREVLEMWVRGDAGGIRWVRSPDHEGPVDCEWEKMR